MKRLLNKALVVLLFSAMLVVQVNAGATEDLEILKSIQKWAQISTDLTQKGQPVLAEDITAAIKKRIDLTEPFKTELKKPLNDFINVANFSRTSNTILQNKIAELINVSNAMIQSEKEEKARLEREREETRNLENALKQSELEAAKQLSLKTPSAQKPTMPKKYQPKKQKPLTKQEQEELEREQMAAFKEPFIEIPITTIATTPIMTQEKMENLKEQAQIDGEKILNIELETQKLITDTANKVAAQLKATTTETQKEIIIEQAINTIKEEEASADIAQAGILSRYGNWLGSWIGYFIMLPLNTYLAAEEYALGYSKAKIGTAEKQIKILDTKIKTLAEAVIANKELEKTTTDEAQLASLQDIIMADEREMKKLSLDMIEQQRITGKFANRWKIYFRGATGVAATVGALYLANKYTEGALKKAADEQLGKLSYFGGWFTSAQERGASFLGATAEKLKSVGGWGSKKASELWDWTGRTGADVIPGAEDVTSKLKSELVGGAFAVGGATLLPKQQEEQKTEIEKTPIVKTKTSTSAQQMAQEKVLSTRTKPLTKEQKTPTKQVISTGKPRKTTQKKEAVEKAVTGTPEYKRAIREQAAQKRQHEVKLEKTLKEQRAEKEQKAKAGRFTQQ